MDETIKTFASFPELVEALRAARKAGLRLVSAAPNPQFGKAVGFKLSDGTVYRITLDKVKEFDENLKRYPELVPLFNLISSTEGRIQLYQTC